MNTTRITLAEARVQAFARNVAPLVELLWPGRILDRHQLQALNDGISGAVREIFSKGCTGCGKTAWAAMLCCIWLALHPRCRVVISSQRFDHAKTVLFSQIAKLWKESPILMTIADPGREGIAIDDDRFLMIASAESGEGMSGNHSVATLIVYDEASSIDDDWFKLAMTQAKLFVALSNPRRAKGSFRLAFDPADPNTTKTIEGPFGPRLCQTIRGSDCINVITGRVIIPGQLTRATYEGIRRDHSARWVSIFAEGEFPAEDSELQLIVPSWLPRHQAAWHDYLPVWAFGLDVADSDDGDTTILASGGPRGCLRLHERRREGTMGTVAWTLATVREEYRINLNDGTCPVVVDGDGVGKGVADRLRELGVWVITFRGSETAADPHTYANARAQCWGELAQRLDPNGLFGDAVWALPNDPLLSAELIAPERVYTSDGVKFRITPKTRAGNTFDGETLKEKLGRSPDRGDAVAYLHLAAQVAWHRALMLSNEAGQWDIVEV